MFYDGFQSIIATPLLIFQIRYKSAKCLSIKRTCLPSSVSSFSSSTIVHHLLHQPLQIINERYKAYSWVAELIQVFIAISVTVSFLVMGSAMKHTSKFTPFLWLRTVWLCLLCLVGLLMDWLWILLTVDGLVSSMWSKRLEWLSKAWERNLPNKHHVCSARRWVLTTGERVEERGCWQPARAADRLELVM